MRLFGLGRRPDRTAGLQPDFQRGALWPVGQSGDGHADGSGGTIELRVHNHGQPIPKETVPSLFQPFKRGKGAEQTSRHGLGLGLYIVHEIIRAHAGEIEVSSTESEGTTVIVRLPRQPPALVGQAAAARKEEPPDSGASVRVRLSRADA
ncbi:MAG: HAMP domain-containing histidine kinase [Myxococcales bacterium]|nr:HAMP domain-containing histidine kinase [Myxococcales bacterium]